MVKISIALILILNGCSSIGKSEILPAQREIATNQSGIAKVTQVETTGEENNYTFAVTVSSPDTGCDSYADWWEIITLDGELLERRILLHSHVEEQPFTRTIDSVAVLPEQKVIVRVHTSNDGYSSFAQQGTVSSGFTATTLPEEFAANLESVEPLPQNCAF